MPRFYVTTPIYYVNDIPHVGTAYSTVVADALRRYHLLRGTEARMLTGTDEHGLKVERVAAERNMTPAAFATSMSAPFREAWPQLHVEADDFLRTTEPRHIRFVQDLWKRVAANGHLYEGSYEDWYCVGCESYKTEKELLPGNVCPIHQKPTEKVKEQTYFFRLSRFEKPLLDLYARRPKFIQPETRRNEVVSFCQAGLRDLSVSRTSFKWGIPVPDAPNHIMYVWFDALANYLSALHAGSDGKSHLQFWPPKARAVHIVGKDILRFHTVYWPAFLLAAGYKEDELPSEIFAHGFLTVDGQKMSKTLRNSVDPLRIAAEMGADPLRYYLLRAIAFGQDGDFDRAALVERYNADLAKNLGNLLSRTLGLASKLMGSKTTATWALSDLDRATLEKARELAREACTSWDELAPHRALEHTWAISSLANQYVDRAAPWAEAKSGNQERVETVLNVLLSLLSGLSLLTWPALPERSQVLRVQLGLAPLKPRAGQDWLREPFAPLAAGEPLPGGPPLFPTIDKDAEAALLGRLAAAAAPATPPPPSPAPPSIATEPPTQTRTLPLPADLLEAGPATSPSIHYDHFAQVDLRVGVIVSAERVPKKDKLLRLQVDLDEEAPRTIIAGLGQTFRPEELVGQRVVVVANLAPRDFGKGLTSFGMILATGGSDALRLATVSGNAPAGSRLK